MQEKDELKDIILNKTPQNNNTKKILLTIATFALILIVVVITMNQMGANKPTNLPHAPKANVVEVEEVVEAEDSPVPMIENEIAHTSELLDDEPLEVAVVEETPQVNAPAKKEAVKTSTKRVPDGKNETQRIMEQAFEDPEIIEEPHYDTKKVTKPKKVVPAKKKAAPKATRPNGKYNPSKGHVPSKSHTLATRSGAYYVQVGSFSKYQPADAFLEKITRRGYTYTYHKVTKGSRTITKVLVGPFKTQASAREALATLRESVERGAFLTKF